MFVICYILLPLIIIKKPPKSGGFLIYSIGYYLLYIKLPSAEQFQVTATTVWTLAFILDVIEKLVTLETSTIAWYYIDFKLGLLQHCPIYCSRIAGL